MRRASRLREDGLALLLRARLRAAGRPFPCPGCCSGLPRSAHPLKKDRSFRSAWLTFFSHIPSPGLFSARSDPSSFYGSGVSCSSSFLPSLPLAPSPLSRPA